MGWMAKTLRKKYATLDDPMYEKSNAIRVSFADKQIDVRCHDSVVIDYSDYRLLSLWDKQQTQKLVATARDTRETEKRQFVLERRRAERFANSFTLGDKYRLDGAFGIAFGQPFAKNSSKQFPVDQPFNYES